MILMNMALHGWGLPTMNVRISVKFYTLTIRKKAHI